MKRKQIQAAFYNDVISNDGCRWVTSRRDEILVAKHSLVYFRAVRYGIPYSIDLKRYRSSCSISKSFNSSMYSSRNVRMR